MSRFDRIALGISLMAIIATLAVAERVFERVPHIEDELCYVWQAKAIAGGDYILPSPQCPGCFMVPFVIDYDGQRFGKYPLGWPVMLSFGVRLGARDLVNPLLAGLAVWLTYLLVRKLTDEKTALLAAVLTLLSPFFLMNAATLLSHVWTLVLTLALTLAWLDTFSPDSRVPRRLTAAVAGLSLGTLALSRPLTAVGVALPFFVHGLILLLRGSPQQRRLLVTIGLLAGGLASLHFLWQYSLTGDALRNPYTLWWSYDTIGFGKGIGLQPDGYQPRHAILNAKFSLKAGWSDLFGWAGISWLFLPFGVFALRRNTRACLVNAIAVSLVGVYLFYWIGSWLFGPRYYYEALPALVLTSAAGIRWLAGNPFADFARRGLKIAQRLRFVAIAALVAGLMAANVLYYLPARLGSMVGLYSFSRSDLQPFLRSGELTPALVFVHTEKTSWMEYGALLELESPRLDSPWLFVWAKDADRDASLAAQYPDRRILHYYPELPDRFYTQPLGDE